jgi:hypothetical protein
LWRLHVAAVPEDAAAQLMMLSAAKTAALMLPLMVASLACSTLARNGLGVAAV